MLIGLVVLILNVQLLIGACFLVSLISSKSKKQDWVSKSSTESKYRAMSSACSEIIWLRGLLGELGFPKLSLLRSMPIILAGSAVPNLLFKLLLTQYFMSAPSTLKWIVTLFVKHIKLASSLFRISPSISSLLICLLRLSPNTDITFLLTN
ncbi:unnamed protein product [Musa hybrid cultivar]